MRFLYAHGFASGPSSTKGRALRDHFAARGLELALLDLRVPSPSSLRLSSMIDVIRDAIGDDTAIAIGSSLGGLTVARAAERDSRIVGVGLIAPAFRLVSRWRARIGDAEWERWRRVGTMRYEDHASAGTIDVDFGFMEDAATIDPIDDADAHAFPALDVPAVVLHGSRDDTVAPALSRAFVATRPHIRLVELDDDHQMVASLPRIATELDALVDHTLRWIDRR